MKTKMRFATVAALLVLTIMSSASQSWAEQTRLRARKNKVVNGIEAELRGDYRENNAPIRLNSDLEQINIPAGTPVAFCLVQNGVSTLLGVGKVALVGVCQWHRWNSRPRMATSCPASTLVTCCRRVNGASRLSIRIQGVELHC